jgi:hypothetical protein
MTPGTRAGARSSPTGRSVNLAFQAALWFAFVFGYQLIQAGAGQDRGRALANGLGVVELERDRVHGLVELRLQEVARDSGALDTFVALTSTGAFGMMAAPVRPVRLITACFLSEV